MEDISSKSGVLITCSYKKYRQQLVHYINHCINGKRDDAEDLVQDVFLRLIDYRLMLREETIKVFIFTIARHLVVDYLRRYYKRQEAMSYLYDQAGMCVDDVESRIVADDLKCWEWKKIIAMPPQRQKIYNMSRFKGMTVLDIANTLNLSPRTVENHLFLGRKEIRKYMQCI